MPKLDYTIDTRGRKVNVMFDCPGCGRTHAIYTQDTPADFIGPRWTFNGDFEKPVLSPSLKCEYHEEGVSAPGDTDKVCHSFVGCNGAQPGQIIFLGDCTHALAGQVVDLPQIKD